MPEEFMVQRIASPTGLCPECGKTAPLSGTIANFLGQDGIYDCANVECGIRFILPGIQKPKPNQRLGRPPAVTAAAKRCPECQATVRCASTCATQTFANPAALKAEPEGALGSRVRRLRFDKK